MVKKGDFFCLQTLVPDFWYMYSVSSMLPYLETKEKTSSIKALIIEPQHNQVVKNNKKTVSTDIHSESVRFKWLAQKRQH